MPPLRKRDAPETKEETPLVQEPKPVIPVEPKESVLGTFTP